MSPILTGFDHVGSYHKSSAVIFSVGGGRESCHICSIDVMTSKNQKMALLFNKIVSWSNLQIWNKFTVLSFAKNKAFGKT